MTYLYIQVPSIHVPLADNFTVLWLLSFAGFRNETLKFERTKLPLINFFNYLVFFIFVAYGNHENILTTKISSFMVLRAAHVWLPNAFDYIPQAQYYAHSVWSTVCP